MADRSVKVYLKGDISDFNKAMWSASAGAKAFSKELDSSTDRATNLTQSVLALGPALVPISAAAVPAISGLTNQFAFASAGAGVAVLAFQGVGDALKATNDYAVEPTTANFDKMRQSLDEIGPAGREFVGFLQELRPQLQGLQDAAQAGLFPGLQSGIKDLVELLPQAERIVSNVSTTLGQLFAEAGDNLNDPRWVEFFSFLEREAKPTLLDMGRTLGNFAEGFANLWMAFDPLSDQFSHSFLRLSRDFAQWTDGLSKTEGFQEFVAYIQTNGPRAWEALEAIGNALLQIVEAAAPVGAATLPIITALADGIATLANSDLGPIVIGVVSLTAALSRLKALGTAANSSAIGGLFGRSPLGGGLANIKAATAAADELRVAQAKLADNPGMQGLTTYKENLKGVAEAEKSLGAATKARNAQFRAAGVSAGAMAFVMSDLDDKLGLTNTAMLAMAGSMAGPWGAGLGAGVGLVMDLASAGESAAEKIQSLTAQVNAAGALSGAERHDISVTGSSLVDDEESLRASEQLDAALDRNRRSAEDAKIAEYGLTDAMQGASEGTRNETLALLDNIAAKNKAADAAESIFSAETNYRQALKDAQEQAKKTNAGIDGSSDAALKNRESLDRLANAWNRQADAGGKTRAEMGRAQKAFIKVAEDMGVGSKRARELASDLFHIPKDIKVGVQVDLGRAYTQIDNLKRYLKGIKDEEVRVHIRESIESGGGRGHQTVNANGNILDFYANGGLRENHIAQIAPATTMRVWAEPETGGEAYIPLAMSKRERSLDIWAETGRRLGAKVQRMADGGVMSIAHAAAMQAPSVIVPGIDYDRLADAVAARKIVLGSREFALAVQDANNYAGRH